MKQIMTEMTIKKWIHPKSQITRIYFNDSSLGLTKIWLEKRSNGTAEIKYNNYNQFGFPFIDTQGGGGDLDHACNFVERAFKTLGLAQALKKEHYSKEFEIIESSIN